MNGSLGSNILAVSEAVLCLVALACILLRKQASSYKVLCALLGYRIASDALLLPLLIYGGYGINAHTAYRLYFYIYWVSFAVESVLGLLLIYSIFNLAMAPLGGLVRLGTLVFRWAAGISVTVAFATAISPHLSSRGFVASFVTELQRTQSVLTLCLLLFVCFAIRPIGLTYSSRVFGVSFGLGILATSNLVASAWMAHFRQMYTTINMVTGVTTCGVLMMWAAYFALPEPKRRMIVLPTTSPFLRWNHIAQVLGDDPGFVAVAGIPPELFAPAELEVMRRASVKMVNEPSISRRKHPQTA